MKADSLFAVALVCGTNAWGQGQFGFGNRVGGDQPIDAPVYDTDCRTRLDGPAFLWQVYAGLTPDALQLLGTVLPFRTGAAAGYINSNCYEVPGAIHGTIVQTQLRAWDAAAGSTFDAAVVAGGKHGFSNIVPISAILGSGYPNFPVGLQSFCLMPPLGPEPRIMISTTPLSSNVEVDIVKRPDWTVVLQASTDLMAWLPLATNMLSDTVWIVEQPKSSAQQFYRAVRKNP